MSNLGGLHSPRPVSYMQQHGSQGASYNLFNQYQAQNQAVRGLAGSTQPYADTPPPMSVSGATSLGPSTPGVNSVAASFYGSGPSLSGSASFGGGMGGLSLGNGAGVGLGGVLGAGSSSIPSQLAAQHQQQEENKIYQLVIDLLDVNTREAALLELSKKREQYDDLALVLWHSFGMLECVL